MKIEYLLVFLHLMMIALCRYFIQMTLFLPLVGSVLNSVGCGGKKGGGAFFDKCTQSAHGFLSSTLHL